MGREVISRKDLEEADLGALPSVAPPSGAGLAVAMPPTVALPVSSPETLSGHSWAVSFLGESVLSLLS
jgi:hypothetical protein